MNPASAELASVVVRIEKPHPDRIRGHETGLPGYRVVLVPTVETYSVLIVIEPLKLNGRLRNQEERRFQIAHAAPDLPKVKLRTGLDAGDRKLVLAAIQGLVRAAVDLRTDDDSKQACSPADDG